MPVSIQGLMRTAIEASSSPESFARGEDYLTSGRVLSVVEAEPGRIKALVKGTQFMPYDVRVSHGPEGVEQVSCSCPFATGSWCKHIVAVLLGCLPGEVPENTLVDLVKALPRDILEQMAIDAAHRSGMVEEGLREIARDHAVKES